MHAMREGGKTLSLEAIKRWRQEQYDAGLPCGFNDYFQAHGICKNCKGSGLVAFYYYNTTSPGRFDPCPKCAGTGIDG